MISEELIYCVTSTIEVSGVDLVFLAKKHLPLYPLVLWHGSLPPALQTVGQRYRRWADIDLTMVSQVLSYYYTNEKTFKN